MPDRDLILGSLPDPAADVVAPIPAPYDRQVEPISDLWLEFEERLSALGGAILPLAALPMLLGRDAAFYGDADALGAIGAEQEAERSVWDAEIGLCLAEFAVAETGSLVVSAGPGRARLTSLAPPVNVVLIREDAIVPTLEAAFVRIPNSTTVLITGTSRTADIEGILVRGVHGPRELYVVKLAAEPGDEALPNET